MKMVFKNFEQQLEIQAGKVNVLRFENKELFSRCVHSLCCLFEDGCLEPAYFFEGTKEKKPKDVLFLVGDLAFFDLNDKAFAAAALKKVSAMLIEDEAVREESERLNNLLLQITFDTLNQLSANYDLVDEWDASKYLKSMGFCIEREVENLFEKALQILCLSADLLPEKILVFVNLATYLTQEQQVEFSRQVEAMNLLVLSYEIGDTFKSQHIDSGIFVDANFLEYQILSKEAVSCSRDFAPFEVLGQRHFG
jgi:CRISPR type II-A-associated protein Csn2